MKCVDAGLELLVVDVQERALLTYIRRVYYPFLLRDPEISPVDGMLCAYWVHTHPTLSGMPQVRLSFIVACRILRHFR